MYKVFWTHLRNCSIFQLTIQSYSHPSTLKSPLRYKVIWKLGKTLYCACVCVFYTFQHISIWASTFQEPSSHMWLVAIILDSPALTPSLHPPFFDSLTPLVPGGACWVMLDMRADGAWASVSSHFGQHLHLRFKTPSVSFSPAWIRCILSICCNFSLHP